MSRRSGSIDSPGTRDRGPCRIADESACDRTDRPQHHGTRHRAEGGVTGPVLCKRCGGREQQDHGGSGEGSGHDVRPSNMKLDGVPALWPDHEASWPTPWPKTTTKTPTRRVPPVVRRVSAARTLENVAHAIRASNATKPGALAVVAIGRTGRNAPAQRWMARLRGMA